MLTEGRYLPPHKREGGTLENVVEERPNAARARALKGFLLKLIQLYNLEHMKGAFLSMET